MKVLLWPPLLVQILQGGSEGGQPYKLLHKVEKVLSRGNELRLGLCPLFELCSPREIKGKRKKKPLDLKSQSGRNNKSFTREFSDLNPRAQGGSYQTTLQKRYEKRENERK